LKRHPLGPQAAFNKPPGSAGATADYCRGPISHLFFWLAPPLAAAGLVLVMVGAAIFHARKSEFPAPAFPVVLGALAAVTVFLRLQVVPL
jgi:hypothetical protein